MYQYPDYLMHYGVKGMKWGVRHDKKFGSNRHKKYSADYEATRKTRRKSSKYLSNDELRQLNKRMQLEQEYNKLSTRNVDIHRGMQYAGALVGVSAAIGSVYAIKNQPWINDLVSSINDWVIK